MPTPTIPTHKFCPECRTDLPLRDFYGDRTRPDGLQGRCKECSKRNAKQNYQKNREAIIQRVIEHRKKNTTTATT